MILLDKVDSPKDLKRLKIEQLAPLAAEMRKFLLQSVSQTGGHLASNLGVVELTIALHYCLNSPQDKIVWDVGHQSYPHKILTGRRAQFDTLRKMGGLSGFIKSAESPHDAFDVGHSSTSLSAALGMAIARDLRGANTKVAAVIGDGSLTSGLALEGLNNIGRSDTDIIVFLNDNQMSISENVGALSRYLNDLRSAPTYISAKRDVRRFLKSIPFAGRFTKDFIKKAKSQLKYLLLPGVLFQELGFKYYGPVDGHDINQLISVVQNVKAIRGPILVHVLTKKGKGYAAAMRRPHKFHGVEPFNPATGQPVATKREITYTDIFSKKIVEMGRQNEKIVAITASMPDGCGLTNFKKAFPARFFDVGIAESHAVTFAAGLAKAGFHPIVSIYSTFLQRAYDQILHDVCIQKLSVVFAIDRAGFVGADGETHQGVFDLSYLSHMPGMTVLAPRDGKELEAMLEWAFARGGPVAIRYPKAAATNTYTKSITAIEYGKWEILEQGEGIALLSVGSMLPVAHDVWQRLGDAGFSPALISSRFVKPLDAALLEKLRGYDHIFTLEENVYDGGFGQRLSFAMMGKQVHVFAVRDEFLPAASREELPRLTKLDADSVFSGIMEAINHAKAP
ncbi:MAG: 1-deoxy-D-xylulose-5-phosphate synthase [Clostridiales bacterium]|jgi:1-deoxy-D-xylulose-5-phosphate synthase|nr:1-deoxy-D-xylulose-5-phosphate synthase [Clostridiales bacterium]